MSLCIRRFQLGSFSTWRCHFLAYFPNYSRRSSSLCRFRSLSIIRLLLPVPPPLLSFTNTHVYIFLTCQYLLLVLFMLSILSLRHAHACVLPEPDPLSIVFHVIRLPLYSYHNSFRISFPFPITAPHLLSIPMSCLCSVSRHEIVESKLIGVTVDCTSCLPVYVFLFYGCRLFVS